MSSVKEKNRNWQNVLMPIFGILILVAAAGIAYALHEIAYEFAYDAVDGLPSAENQPEILFVSGFVIFLVMISLFAAIFTLFAPKPPNNISEESLAKEKKERADQLKRDKIRQKKMREQARRERQRNS